MDWVEDVDWVWVGYGCMYVFLVCMLLVLVEQQGVVYVVCGEVGLQVGVECIVVGIVGVLYIMVVLCVVIGIECVEGDYVVVQ